MGKKAVRRGAKNLRAEKIHRTTAKKKNNKSPAEDEVYGVDDSYERNNGERISTRSSPSYFISVMNELVPILGERQKTLISKTPFAKWLDMPALALSTGRVDYFLTRFNASSCSFIVAPDFVIPFRSSDFSVILGLRHSGNGRPIDFHTNKHSSFLSRRFSGKLSNTTRGKIREKMRLHARSSNEGEVDDFVRLFILLIFNCVIFPTGNYVTPGFVFAYLDDLSTFFDHAWGDAAFRFLHQEICELGTKFYMEGCVVGLMALVYESLPALAVDRGLNVHPRLFRWAKSYIPLDSAKAESLLKSVVSAQILSTTQPSHKEEELLVSKPGLIPKDETPEVRRLENVVIRQNDEIKALKRKCAELEDRCVRSGADEKEVVDGATARADRASRRRWSVVVDPPPSRSKRKREVKTRLLVDFDQDSSIPVDPPPSRPKRKRELKRQVDVDQDSSIPVDPPTSSTQPLEDFDQDSSIPVDPPTSRTRPLVEVDQDSSIPVDPPTSRPKSKRGVKTQIFVDLDQDSITSPVDVDQDSTIPEKKNTDEFKGRVDFIGHENAWDEDKKLVTDFLAKDEPEADVWDDGYIRLSRHDFCTFLFREAVGSEIVNVFMKIMQKQSLENGSEIHCLDTNVQREVLDRLDKYRKSKTINKIDFKAVLSTLTSFTRDRLAELNEDVFKRCKYVVFPINDSWHWFLLVFDTKQGIFRLWNSNHAALATGTAKVYMRFLAGCVRCFSGFDAEDVSKESCRQQGATLDCGVFVSMWLNCLAYDTPEIWECEEEADVAAYRVRIAATILGSPRQRF